jgi:hypothetical protein
LKKENTSFKDSNKPNQEKLKISPSSFHLKVVSRAWEILKLPNYEKVLLPEYFSSSLENLGQSSEEINLRVIEFQMKNLIFTTCSPDVMICEKFFSEPKPKRNPVQYMHTLKYASEKTISLSLL